MTEKQGGTDVRANTTQAVSADGAAGPGGPYALTGHKWSLSAPMSDAFLVLAQARRAVVLSGPALSPGRQRQPNSIAAVESKLGNRSNASSEVEFAGALAWLIGEEGRGVANIIEMVTFTRLDCAIALPG